MIRSMISNSCGGRGAKTSSTWRIITRYTNSGLRVVIVVSWWTNQRRPPGLNVFLSRLAQKARARDPRRRTRVLKPELCRVIFEKGLLATLTAHHSARGESEKRAGVVRYRLQRNGGYNQLMKHLLSLNCYCGRFPTLMNKKNPTFRDLQSIPSSGEKLGKELAYAPQTNSTRLLF